MQGVSQADLIRMGVAEKYASEASPPAYERIYLGEGRLSHTFAVLHKRLNEHFLSINGRADSTRHYWAEPSRQLIELIREINQVLHDLNRAGDEFVLEETYERAIEYCTSWLSPSGGSTVPEDYRPVSLIQYEPIFVRNSSIMTMTGRTVGAELRLEGEGSYACVYSFEDPEYETRFALKRAKSNIADRDLQRFRREFEVMKGLSFPYIVEVYKYSERADEYSMEYCDETLRSYISSRGDSLRPSTRLRIAEQFLYAVNYLHSKNILHRDISLQNILLKTYDSGAVLVKLSDFGLIKEAGSGFTMTQTQLRGTIRDPQLESLKDYTVANEIYSIGWVIQYILTGRESLLYEEGPVAEIVRTCTSEDVTARFKSIPEVIKRVQALRGTQWYRK